MPSNAEKFVSRARTIAEAYRVHRFDLDRAEDLSGKIEVEQRLLLLRGRIEGLLIAKCEVTGQVASEATVEAKADELLGVERRAGASGLIR